ncbi:hypothetical protein MBM_03408 [Drepanopeziza brunnea f. sp. 'multigermtubi' MB_m1]|uniref:Uncharacterized protein n=1 Tax=Marssonina brunnea f. sp. multigermtubi (strain MB_m1) TaxID=1072389 RepID=K1WL29_MARBU|nr:uncharacterized protein MBM_03408 [Drepanopeziza brunnea f. sp. 'multigermtubi' MB_m1]EKD18415.1 hypothetical protein MBM_03408 [Drepanopeziza brunnea f. sp. 'multigermtubi' MB_m1]
MDSETLSRRVHDGPPPRIDARPPPTDIQPTLISVEDGFATYRENYRKSTNPFRKQEDTSDSDSSILRSSESAQSIGKRKDTPTRAVFNDLHTAYSSIISGTARSRVRNPSNSQAIAAEEDHSIALQELDPSSRPKEASFRENPPLVPFPAVLPRSRSYERGHDFLGETDEFAVAYLGEPLKPSLPERDPSVLSSLKNAIASIASPLPSHWPKERQNSVFDHDARSLEESPHDVYYVEDNSIYHSSHYHSGSQAGPHGKNGIGSSSYRHTSNHCPLIFQSPTLPPSSPPPPIGTQPYKSSRLLSSSTNISVPEGSTIGNIVQHYVSSGGREGDKNSHERPGIPARQLNLFNPQNPNKRQSPSSPLYGPLEPSELRVKKQRKTENYFGQPYSQYDQTESSDSAMPKSSSIEVQHGNRGAEYGQGTKDSQDDSGQYVNESSSDVANSTLPSLPRISHKNSHRYSQARNSLQRTGPNHSVYDDGLGYARKPLEREVSEALRRASGYSAYSVDSVSSSLLDFGAIINYGKNPANQSLVKLTEGQNGKGKGHAHSVGQHGGVHIVDKQGTGFYDESAIPSDWINSHQSIRVPINHNVANHDVCPDFPPAPPTAMGAQKSRNRRSTPDSDANDWETVGEAESAFGLFYGDENDPGMLGGAFHRAGSSIANTSDAGSSSMAIAELEDFGSTDRIAQHPGSIQYSGDYRQREVKKLKAKVPVLMPVFQEHKVNGYLADSMRLRQPQSPAYFQSPPPLSENHKHPFNSSPPDVARVITPKSILRSFLSPGGPKEKNETSKSRKAEQRSDSEWRDSYRQHGPYISTQIHPFARQGINHDRDRPNSYAYVVDHAHDESMPAMSSSEPPATSAKSRSDKDKMPLEELNDEVANLIGKKRPVFPTRIEPASARRPPGAFYQGVRTVSDQPRVVSNQNDGFAKILGNRNASKTYASKTLRPLSLVADRQPSTPVSSTIHSPYVEPNTFVYRSPLAPLKVRTWEKLYSVSRLFEFKERAKADGFHNSRSTISADESERLARRHVYEPPRLMSRDGRGGSIYNSLSRKSKISWVAFAICAIFPPALVLYSLGVLDCVMASYSENEFYEFGKKQKKWAMIVMGIELLVIGILVAAAVGQYLRK